MVYAPDGAEVQGETHLDGGYCPCRCFALPNQTETSHSLLGYSARDLGSGKWFAAQNVGEWSR